MALSELSKVILMDYRKSAIKEVSDIDHKLAPLLAEREKLDERILALQGRKNDLVKNSSDINEDTKG